MPLLIVKHCCRTRLVPSCYRSSRALGKAKVPSFLRNSARGVIIGGGTSAAFASMAGVEFQQAPQVDPGPGIPDNESVSKGLPLHSAAADAESRLAMSELKNWRWLADRSPGFPVKGENVHVITCPNVFYNTLLEKVACAKKRISLASLYLGNGSMEHELVSVGCGSHHRINC